VAQDLLVEAKEAYKDAKEDMHEQHARMTEDLLFSNPSEPKQWDENARQLRKGRPCLTFDRTNQFVMQVVNDGRQNKPSIKVIPADSDADIDVAEKLNGIIRHIEYVSRAGAAYDMALECAARTGLGWIRVIPQIMRPETNEQEIRIMRVHDPKSVMLQAGWNMQDGSDAKHGFAECMYSIPQFKAMWPKAKAQGWEGADGWYTDESVRVCEYYKVDETKSNRIVAMLNGKSNTYGEEDYHREARPAGAKIVSNYTDVQRKVRWIKMSGLEVLEETEFPSQYIPLIPAFGYEMWAEGKRYLCGLPRRLRDQQQYYNYMQSAIVESLAAQPKAPFIVPFEAIEDFEAEWKSLNSSNPAYLPYNSLSADNQPIPAPVRLSPPAFPVAFANTAQIASQDMEAAVGMFKANLGQQSNETSGIAIRKREQQGDTANFHYIDNISRAVERTGMVIVDMIPKVYDKQRQARIVHEDGAHDFVEINPEQKKPARKQGKKVVSINVGIGAYDVRVKTGPAFASLREEQADNLGKIMQAAPETAPILADLWIGSQDWPDAEKAQKRLQAMLPPQIQQMESDEGEEMPPAAMAQIQMLSAAKDQLSHALETAAQQHQDLENQVKAGTQAKMIDAQSRQQAEEAKFQREMQMKTLERAMQNEALATQRYIAELNAKVALAAQGTDAAQAQQALISEHILEGQRLAASERQAALQTNVDSQNTDKKLAVDVHKHETGLDAQAQSQEKDLTAQAQSQSADHQAAAQSQDKALASSEKIAASKPKPVKA
jgi:hypothetical protein